MLRWISDRAHILQPDGSFHRLHPREIERLAMRLHEQADEFQRVVELAVAVALPLAKAGAGLDLPRGRFTRQRECDEAPAIEINRGLIAPVAAVEVLGRAPALAPGILDLPED